MLGILFDFRTPCVYDVRSSHTVGHMHTSPTSIAASIASAFEVAATAWWAAESTDWDDLVAGGPASPTPPGGASLWGGMPVVDSKAVARLAPIFKDHFGVPLDPKTIRPGGYNSISEAARDLEAKHRARGNQSRPGAVEARI